jgi:hypothetical protein
LTNTVVLANAIIDFVDVMVGSVGTVDEAIKAANDRFADNKVADRFVRVHGDGESALI